ncbi:MAG: hypothetical protein ACTSV1_05665, partial [Alphaproteobacteria bacterium]
MTAMTEQELDELRSMISCGFEQLDVAFAGCMDNARTRLSSDGMDAFMDGASTICQIGRGFEPVLVYLEEMPELAESLGEDMLGLVSQTVWDMSRTPNGRSIPPLLAILPEAARRLGSPEQFRLFIGLIEDFMERTTGSIHGHHTTIPSPGLTSMLENTPYLLNQLSLEGLKNWVDYGIRYYGNHPERQKDYFELQSADSRAVLQRERQGTLFADHERKLSLYMKALWEKSPHFVPYSTGFDELRKPFPYYDELGIRVPDVYDDSRKGILGIDRYRALLAHIAAHQRWTQAIFADNFSPFQRLASEIFEDSRVEYLAMRIYPGLRRLWLGLHPRPIEGDCDESTESCIRHRLIMFSYAVLDPNHTYRNPDLLEFVGKFHDAMNDGDGTTQSIAGLASSFIARTRLQSDQSAKMYFTDTEVDYRDDNRHMWKFIELGDEEEMFDEAKKTSKDNDDADQGLPPRHYAEWDYTSKTYRPDWVSLYESLHPSGNAADIDKLLDKHAALAKLLKQILDMLKPQNYVRQRYQEDGSDLDLDVAIRSLIDFKSGCTPDPRINMSHRHDGRDIAVLLLLDL